MWKSMWIAACGASILAVGAAYAHPPQDSVDLAASPRCIARDTTDLSPTLRAPDWYMPGVTRPCSPIRQKAARLLTAYWTDYECNFYATCWRTSPLNADYSAKACEGSYTTCGAKIIHDAAWFHSTCTGLGLSKYEVARNIRYWADRARANGANWRVYTFTESGGNPYGCRFSVTAL